MVVRALRSSLMKPAISFCVHRASLFFHHYSTTTVPQDVRGSAHNDRVDHARKGVCGRRCAWLLQDRYGVIRSINELAHKRCYQLQNSGNRESGQEE